MKDKQIPALTSSDKLRTKTGLLLILASYVFSWPLIGALGVLSAHAEQPSIITIGGPVAYVFSYFLLAGGVYLAGKECSKIVIQRFKGLVKKAAPQV